MNEIPDKLRNKQMAIESIKMTHQEAGKLGARALNTDIEKKRAAAKKAARTRMAKNPKVFNEMGIKGGSATHKRRKK